MDGRTRHGLILFVAVLAMKTILGEDLNGRDSRNYLHNMLNRIQNDRMEPKEESDKYLDEDYGYNNLVFAEDDPLLGNFNDSHYGGEGDMQQQAMKPEMPLQDLLKFIFSKPSDSQHEMKPNGTMQSDMGGKPESGSGTGQEPLAYEYYYYPLKNLESLKDGDLESADIPPELAQVIKTLKPIMPAMPNAMKDKKKTPVGPLFYSMAMFVTSALVFIATILLMPRVRLVKAKSLEEQNQLNFESIQTKIDGILGLNLE